MTTYTVTNRDGEVEARGLTLADAAHQVMIWDGHEYEIRPDERGGFQLWTSRHSRNSTAYDGLHKSAIMSIEDDRTTAEAQIFQEVIDHADWWGGQMVQTDADYNRDLAEWRAQEAE